MRPDDADLASLQAPEPPTAASHDPQAPRPEAEAAAGKPAAKLAGLAGVSALMSAVLAACGGDSDSSNPPSGIGSPSPVPGGGSPVPVPAPGTPGSPTPAPSPGTPSPSPGTPSPSPGAPAPSPGTPAPPAPANISAEEAARFLLQAQFSASEAEISAVQQKGYSAWLDEQMDAPSHTTGWDWLMSQNYHADPGRRFNSRPTDYMIWNQLIAAPDALRKRVALAWSEILVVSTEGLDTNWIAFSLAAYWDLLNRHAFGNYRELLEDISLNAAMGSFLNTRGNRKADPNTGRVPDENYAREIMQLFSIGLLELNADGTPRAGNVETYSMSDVTNLAQIFTGYVYAKPHSEYKDHPENFRLPMRVEDRFHSTDSVTFLGQTVGSGDAATRLKAALDIIAGHHNVGPFIARQLIQRLVTGHPSPAYVGRVAAVFNNNGAGVRGDLRAVTKAVLLDEEARQAPALKSTTWGKLREPMVRFVQWARTFNASSSDGKWMIADLSSASYSLGQSPLRSPSVFNFFRPGYVPPGTALASMGHTAPEFQITNENSVAGYINFMRGIIANGYKEGSSSTSVLTPNYGNEMALVEDAAALVARLNLLLTGNQLSPATVSTIRDAISTIDPVNENNRNARVWAAILMVMSCPEYLVQK